MNEQPQPEETPDISLNRVCEAPADQFTKFCEGLPREEKVKIAKFVRASVKELVAKAAILKTSLCVQIELPADDLGDLKLDLYLKAKAGDAEAKEQLAFLLERENN